MSSIDEPMKGEDKGDGVLAFWIYAVVFLVSVVLIGSAGSLQFEDGWLAHLGKELGFAGIVSLVLILTIETFSRKRHQKAADTLARKINKDLFHAIYGRYIPKAVFGEVEKTILKSNVFRTEHEVTYTLTPREVDGGPPCERHLSCIAQSSYVLQNVTSGTIKHNVTLNLEIPQDHVDWKQLLTIDLVEINGDCLSAEVIAKHTKDTDVQRRFSFPVDIPPGERIKVRTKATLIKRKLDQEMWTSRIPSDGIKLLVVVPKDLDVFAHANHPEDLQRTLDNDGTKRWELRFGMLPYQSLVFWWRTKDNFACPIA